MRAVWGQTYQRTAGTGAALPLPQHTKEAVEKAAKLEKGHSEPGRYGRTGRASDYREEKQELKSLQPKLPFSTQPLRDHGDVVNAIGELDEKGNGETKELE